MNDTAADVLPELRPLLKAAAAMPPIDFTQPPDEVRAVAKRGAAAFRMFYEPIPEMLSTTDVRVLVDGTGIRARVYRPAESVLPALVFFHGGGWWLGDIDADDALCAKVADACGMVVVSVDYRLAPEHAFPIPNEDCYSAVQWVADNAGALGIDADDVSIGGGSAGGNLAASVALMCRDRGGPMLSMQWLHVPATDLTMPDNASLRAFGAGFGLNADDVERCIEFFASEHDRAHPYISPLRADDLAGLPPAVITVAGCDPLRDQGIAYAERLCDAGVPVRLSCWDGHLHGTMGLTGVTPTAERFFAELADAMREVRSVVNT